MDPREEYAISGGNAWVVAHWLRLVADYNRSLREFPNPPGVTLTDPDFGQ